MLNMLKLGRFHQVCLNAFLQVDIFVPNLGGTVTNNHHSESPDLPKSTFDHVIIEAISFKGLNHTHGYVVHRNLIHKEGASGSLHCSQWHKERETLKGLELSPK